MKTDLDSLMQDRNLDALLVVGPGQHNPPMVYLTGGGHMTRAILVKIRGQSPVLFHSSMERDEAARTGLPTRNLDQFRPNELLDKINGNPTRAEAALLKLVFQDMGLESGRVAVYGRSDVGAAYAVFSALKQEMPGMDLVGEVGDTLIMAAMSTKELGEVERIRRMGQVTTSVVGRVADFLTNQSVKDNTLVKPDGSPLTVGDVKRRINLWLAEAGAENPSGTIFATGYDAAVPHSSGTSTDPLRLGQPIIFDIFPCEAEGGYFYDLTRTWCLGYAPDEALALYEDVLNVYTRVIDEIRPGEFFKTYQRLACEFFEARGHPTIKENPVTQEGYTHSLGHGVGLHVQEKPFSRWSDANNERLVPGVVFTVEPGLYYPQRKLAVRLEDTLCMRPDGVTEVLAPYPLDFILPVK
jgi:Xaa-Pro aminopeptidase